MAHSPANIIHKYIPQILATHVSSQPCAQVLTHIQGAPEMLPRVDQRHLRPVAAGCRDHPAMAGDEHQSNATEWVIGLDASGTIGRASG